MIRRSLPVLLALALSACGFHLRESLDLPADIGAMRVRSVDRYSPLADMLEASLERSGAQLAPEGAGEATVLDLLSERWGDTPISVDQFGRAQEYSLRYAVVFELRRADGTTPLPRQTVELSRDYISNPVRAIGTEGEREILARELRREMSAAILRRLNAVAAGEDSVPGTPAPEPPVASDAAAPTASPEMPETPSPPAESAQPAETPQETSAEPPPEPAPR